MFNVNARPFALVMMAFCLLALAGCASFSPYSISEATLEKNLQQVVTDFDSAQLKSGSPLSLSLSEADITLGPDGRDVAVVNLQGKVALNALLTEIPVNFTLSVEGAPVYEAEEKAVYLRRLKLLDSRLESSLFSGDLKPVTDNIMRVVAQWLETVPVYRLDETNTVQRMFGAMPVDVRVVPGRLEFVMSQ
ncbi:MAG: DUF1439 domain-containing protein [Pseudomonadota bacterium]|nr:DUF1439 domain-containing protein [Pseudomonadota bacterium]